MCEKAGRVWHLYLDDMISFIQKALTYTDGLDQHAFVTRNMVYDATLRNRLMGRSS